MVEVTAARRVSPFYLALLVVLAVTAMRYAVLAAQPAPLSMDEIQYWLWSRELAWGYFSKPPLLAWLIAGSTALCGEGEACIRIISPLFHAGTALVLFGVGKRLISPIGGFWCAAVYVLLPGVSVSAVIASTDVPLLFFWAVALYALVRLRDTPTLPWFALLGAAVGLGTLSKYAMLYCVVCLALWALWDKAGRDMLLSRGAALAALIAAGMIAPNVLWNAAHAFVSVRHTAANMNLGGDLFHPAEAAEFIGAQLGVFGPILFVLMALAWRAARSEGGPMKMLTALSLPIVALITVQAFVSRAHANWAATAYVAGTVLAVAWAVLAKKVVWLRAAMGLHLAAAGVLYNYQALMDGLGIALNRKIDPLVRVRSWDGAGQWTTALAGYYPGVRFLFDERQAMAALTYYTQPHPFDARMWNPSGQANNHFEMTASLQQADQKESESFIYVTRQTLPAALAAFADTQPLGQWSLTAYPGHDINLNAFLLTGFRGYTFGRAQ